MVLVQAALHMMAGNLELNTLKENKLHPAFEPNLEALLLDVYASLCPSASDYEKRRQLVKSYNTTAKSVFGNTGGFPVVEAFGSFIMDIFTAKSDLDLSINFNNDAATVLPHQNIISTLRRFSKVLFRMQRKGLVSGVLPVLSAKVPVLKAVDCKTGIECDISVENKDGISRSLFFSVISSIDERFRVMSYLMKAWAKANDINSSKDRTMNSLSIITLVAFHLQTRDPPILPPFSALLRDGTDISNLSKIVIEFKNFGGRNKESVAELFVTLLAELSSTENLWELGLCVSTVEGSWISKTWNSKIGIMSIEDFLDRSQNFARSVGKSEMLKIYNCIKESLKHLSCSMRGKAEISKLRSFLFGPISSTPGMNRISKAGMNPKPELPGNESVLPCGNTTPCNHANRSSAASLKRKLPCIESVQPSIATIKLKKAKNAKAAKTSDCGFHEKGSSESAKPPIYTAMPMKAKNAKAAKAWCHGFHEMESNTCLSNPSTVYPILPFPSQPINSVGYSFIPAGYPSQPVATSYYYGSHHQLQQLPYSTQVVFPSQYQQVAPHAGYPYSPYYARNLAQPIILESRQRNLMPSNAHNVGSTQVFFVQPSSYGTHL